MRTTTKALVSGITAAGIAAGSLAAAGTSVAAVPERSPAASAEAIAPLSWNNLGLSVKDAKRLQGKFLLNYGYTGALDGLLGADSWKAMQRLLDRSGDYSGTVDGIVGPLTVKALQRYLKRWHSYTGAIDGIAGPATTAAFTRMARVT
ncbi:peptidoglycan-binding domain-containing protein [Streptomyces parvus]|uniref:peptidoglycan-binding domain-containing protein n=1 Tax=Streptomyces parvus TaxID=66428 RepID=UPI0033ED14A2